MRTVGLLLLVLGVTTLTAIVLGDAPPFITDYFNYSELEIVSPGLLLLGALLVYVTREEG